MRSVIHLALPKSIEQYYQEAGRAGRDGRPSDCILLWQKKDLGLLTYFNNRIADPAEKQRAWQRYHDICDFAEFDRCRHRQICLHFGETPKWHSCGACDVCASLPPCLTTLKAQPEPKRKRIKPSPPSSVKTPSRAASAVSSAASNGNSQLGEHLRAWRRAEAERRRVPAFTVMHDSSLEELCQVQPDSLDAIRGIHGFGPRKTEMYGKQLLDAIKRFRN